MASKTATSIDGRKFALLTEQMYKSLKDAQKTRELTESGEFQAVKSLDEQLAQVLSNPTLTPSRKVQEYSLILKQFQDSREKAPEINKQPKHEQQQQQYQPAPSRRYIPDTSIEPSERNLDDFYIEDSPFSRTPPPVDYDHQYRLNFDQEEEQVEQPEEPMPEEPAQPEPYAAIASPPKAPAMSSELRQQRLEALKAELANADPSVLSYDKASRQMKIFNHTMPGSNIDAILTYVSNHKPATGAAPKDTAQFLESYGSAGLDPQLIPNKELRKIALAAAGPSAGVGMGKGRQGKFVIKRWEKFY